MQATLSCDHRVVDGAMGAEWLQVGGWVHQCCPAHHTVIMHMPPSQLCRSGTGAQVLQLYTVAASLCTWCSPGLAQGSGFDIFLLLALCAGLPCIPGGAWLHVALEEVG
jgi:hypothetical protein